MNWAERLIAVITVLMLAITTWACYIAATTQMGYSGDYGGPPFSFYFGQAVYGLAPQFAWIGLGSGAGLLFLRGLRWHPRSKADQQN